jgi:teichuronic acid biosynthesis glycosyltransferase TuaC
MKRLLFISTLFPDRLEPYRGLDNATALHALRELGWDIRVLSHRPWFPFLRPPREIRPRTQDAPLRPHFFRSLYLPKAGGLADHRLLAAALKRSLPAEFTPDVVLASWLFPDGCAAWKTFAAPTVLLAQGSDVHSYMKSPLRRRPILNALAGTQACICRSRNLATQLVQWGAEGAKLVPVHNGVDTSVFSLKGSLPTNIMIPAGAPILLFVGNLVPVKNPEFLLKAFANLPFHERDQSPHLVIIGEGPMRNPLESLAVSLNVAQRTHFIGSQSAPQIASWMRRADLLVMTSINEGLPNVILEAQACGLPVVTTDVGGIHEVVDANWKGRLCRSGDLRAWGEAVVDVLSKPSARSALGEVGASRTWAAVAEAYEKVLNDAIAHFRNV